MPLTAQQYENVSIWRIPVHEMGHYVVAKALGFEVLSITIRRDDVHSGHGLFSGHSTLITTRRVRGEEALHDYLSKRISVLLAGSLAQSFDGTEFVQSHLDSTRADNSSDDIGKARELFGVFLNLRQGHGLDLEFSDTSRWNDHPFWQRCEQQARDIVRAQWEDIQKIAEFLKTFFRVNRTRDERTLSPAEIDSLIETGYLPRPDQLLPQGLGSAEGPSLGRGDRR